MPRHPRIHASGLLFHVMARGNNGQKVFLGPADYEAFLNCLRNVRNRYLHYVYAYVSAVYHSNLGLVFRDLGKWDDAERSDLKALELEPDNAGYCNDLGNVFYGKKDYEKAIECYTKTIEKNPRVAVYHANLGLAFKDLGKWEEAENQYALAIGIETDNAEHYNGLGNVHYKLGDYEKAAEQYVKAIQINPYVQVYVSDLVLACKQFEDTDKALALLEWASKYHPNNIELSQTIERLKNG